jgi:hypothetical protein
VVFNQFRDLIGEAERLKAPACAIHFLSVLDQRRRQLPPHMEYVRMGYGGQPRIRGGAPSRAGMVEKVEGQRSRRTFMRGARWCQDNGLVTVDPGGGWRPTPLRQPSRHPGLEYHCARGGCDKGGVGLANGYASTKLPRRGGAPPRKPAPAPAPTAPDASTEGYAAFREQLRREHPDLAPGRAPPRGNRQ